MECHDVQQLLAFVNRKCEELDAPERQAMREHLDHCPDCSAIAQAEWRADDVIGPVLRAVPVPADLRPKLIARLSSERSQARWASAKRGVLAAAAVLLVAVVGGVSWHYWRLPDVTVNDAVDFAEQGGGMDDGQVAQFFAEQGLLVEVPDEFDFRMLRRAEVVEFKNRRVARLTFQREHENGRAARAEVLILPHKQFRVDKLSAQDFHAETSLRILHKEHFTYLIFFRDSIDGFLRVLN